MGFGGISATQLLILLAIAAVVFGTGRIKNLGGDLGNAIKGFRQAMRSDDEAPPRIAAEENASGSAVSQPADRKAELS